MKTFVLAAMFLAALKPSYDYRGYDDDIDDVEMRWIIEEYCKKYPDKTACMAYFGYDVERENNNNNFTDSFSGPMKLK